MTDRISTLHLGIITHTYATGPAQELETFLKPRAADVVFIGHPLPFCQDQRSVYRRIERGRLVESRTAREWAVPEVMLYVKDVVYSVIWCLRQPWAFDVLIAVDCLNVFAGWCLKRLGRARAVVFYTIDYVPQRFRNKLLNRIYHWMDSFAVACSDQVWNLSSVMVTEREKKGIPPRYRSKQITVPIGTDLSGSDEAAVLTDRWTIAFMGHLRPGQGVELVIDALPEIAQKLPDVRLMIIGTGPLENDFKSRAKDLGISNRITFAGFIPDHHRVLELLKKCSVGVAPYVDDIDSLARNTDLGKPKAYLACGLPVVITRVNAVADEIDRELCGIAIAYNRNAFVEAVIRLLSDESRLRIHRENALRLARKYDWNKVFTDAFTAFFGRTDAAARPEQ